MDALILLAFGFGVLALLQDRDPPEPKPVPTTYSVEKVGEARGSCVYRLNRELPSGNTELVGYIVGNSSATAFTTSNGKRYAVTFDLNGQRHESVNLHPTEAGAFASIPYPDDDIIPMPPTSAPDVTDWTGRGFGSGGPFDVNAPADGW